MTLDIRRYPIYIGIGMAVNLKWSDHIKSDRIKWSLTEKFWNFEKEKYFVRKYPLPSLRKAKFVLKFWCEVITLSDHIKFKFLKKVLKFVKENIL